MIVVSLNIKSVDESIRDIFIMVVRDLFAKRRKTIKNNIISGKCGKIYEKEKLINALEASGVSPQSRAEKLTINDFIKIAKEVDKL